MQAAQTDHCALSCAFEPRRRPHAIYKCKSVCCGVCRVNLNELSLSVWFDYCQQLQKHSHPAPTHSTPVTSLGYRPHPQHTCACTQHAAPPPLPHDPTPESHQVTSCTTTLKNNARVWKKTVSHSLQVAGDTCDWSHTLSQLRQLQETPPIHQPSSI